MGKRRRRNNKPGSCFSVSSPPEAPVAPPHPQAQTLGRENRVSDDPISFSSDEELDLLLFSSLDDNIKTIHQGFSAEAEPQPSEAEQVFFCYY